MPNFRGFIAVEIPANPKIQEVKDDIKRITTNIKLVELENIHITLKFLGDTDERFTEQIQKILNDAVTGIQPFLVKLKHTGVFPNKNYIKVIWIGIEDNGVLSTIASRLEENLESLGFPKEKRAFSPHLTIGRVKTAEHKDKLLQIIEKYANEDFGEFLVTTISLKKSELTPKGPIYTTLKEVKL